MSHGPRARARFASLECSIYSSLQCSAEAGRVEGALSELPYVREPYLDEPMFTCELTHIQVGFTHTFTLVLC